MIKIIFIFTLITLSRVFDDEKGGQEYNDTNLSNADLEFGQYEKLEKSAVGKPVRIRVFYKNKSTPPTKSQLVNLLDKEGRTLPYGRQIWLVGFGSHLSTMQEGNKYLVDGILVEDKGFYSALVVYARNIIKISEQAGADQPATAVESKPRGEERNQSESEERSQ